MSEILLVSTHLITVYQKVTLLLCSEAYFSFLVIGALNLAGTFAKANYQEIYGFIDFSTINEYFS